MYIHIYIYIYTYTYSYVHIHVYICTHIYTYIHTYLYIRIYTYRYSCIYLNHPNNGPSICIYPKIHTYGNAQFYQLSIRVIRIYSYIYIHIHIRKYIYICRTARLRQLSMRVTVPRCHASVYGPPATLQHSRQISGASLTTATAIYRGIVDLPMTGSNITTIIVDLPVTSSTIGTIVTAIDVRPVIKMSGASTVGSTYSSVVEPISRTILSRRAV